MGSQDHSCVFWQDLIPCCCWMRALFKLSTNQGQLSFLPKWVGNQSTQMAGTRARKRARESKQGDPTASRGSTPSFSHYLQSILMENLPQWHGHLKVGTMGHQVRICPPHWSDHFILTEILHVRAEISLTTMLQMRKLRPRDIPSSYTWEVKKPRSSKVYGFQH